MSPKLIFQRAISESQAGHLCEARELANQVLAIKRKNPEVLGLLGVIALAEQRSEEAISLLSRLVKYKPAKVEAHYHLGLALMQAGETAVRLAPDYPGPHNNLAGAYEMIGNKDAVLAHFRKAAELEPGNPMIPKNLGNVYTSRGRCPG